MVSKCQFMNVLLVGTVIMVPVIGDLNIAIPATYLPQNIKFSKSDYKVSI